MTRMQARRAGFTLIELLVAMAVLSLLAGAAVFAYKKYVKDSYTSEVYAMIASLKNAEDSYKAETGQYLSTGNSETDYYPVLRSAGTEPTRKLFQPTDPRWKALGVSPPSKHIYCGYVVIAGTANNLAGAGSRGVTIFGGAAPKVDWYYIRASCDLDSNASKDSFFETAFDRQVVYKGNVGH
ncbi:MAG: type II secretion system protein [Deltaproteobacteria bacterium]|nr:type II secretion system protein [Deltaproteobacteria bacterium]